jgi:hypothetical protein
MTESNVMSSISIERLHSIEKEREEVMGSIGFQKWMEELNVSQSWEDPNPKLKAVEIMSQWDTKGKWGLGLM